MQAMLLQSLPLGDSSCWTGMFNYERCCSLKSLPCWDAAFTPLRCCGEQQISMFGIATNFSSNFVICLCAFMRDVLHFGMFICVPAACLKVFGRSLDPINDETREMPVATILRTIATLGVVLAHFKYQEWSTQTLAEKWLLSLYIVQMDFFFVLSSYLAATTHSDRSSQHSSFQNVLVVESAAILRRVIRIVPTVMVSSLLRGNLALTWASSFYGAGLFLFGWPFGVEFLCYTIMRALRILADMIGTNAMVSIDILLVAISLGWYLHVGPVPPRFRLQVSIVLHRLPLCLTTNLCTRVCRTTLSYRETKDRMQPCLLWTFAICGNIATASFYWCQHYGPQGLLSWWAYPLIAKLPLVLSSVMLLEFSRTDKDNIDRREAPSWKSILRKIDEHSLPSIINHLPLKHGLEEHVFNSDQQFGFALNLFQFPSYVFWLFVANSVLLWAQQPYRRFLQYLLLKLQEAAAMQDAARLESITAGVSRMKQFLSCATLAVLALGYIGVVSYLTCLSDDRPCALDLRD